MASLFKKIVKTANTISSIKSITSAAKSNTLASSALNSAITSRNIGDQLNSISGFGKSSLSNALFGGSSQLTGLLDITAGFPQLGKINNILAAAVELEGIVSSPIRVTERSKAEIFNAAGGRFDELRTLVSNLADSSSFDQFIKNFGANIKDSIAKPGGSKSLIENPLRQFSSYNYRIKMGILSSKEYNNPESYRSVGFENYIIKSTGGELDQRVQVDQEVRSPSPGHAEYFIDDFVYDAAVAPNPKTGVTLGTTFNFAVLEPYSMGNFIEALVVAAKTANDGQGYESYFAAPFCLKIDFQGWTDGAPANSDLKPIYLPFMITEVNVAVDGKGSRYECSGVAFNELALADHMNMLYTQVKCVGTIPHQLLQTGDKSLTAGLNKRVEALEDSEIIPGWDRFIICFPKNRDSISKYLSSGSREREEIDVMQTIVEQKGTKDTELENKNINNQAKATANARVKGKTTMFETLLAFAEDESQMNQIGLSQVLQDSTQGGNQDSASLNGAIQDDNPDDVVVTRSRLGFAITGTEPRSKLAKENAEDPCGGEETTAGLVDKGSASMGTAEFARVHEFEQGAAITTCIEQIILNTEFCKENATAETEENGLKRWFRIESDLFIEDNPTSESSMGRPPYVCVFSVHEYKVVAANFIKSDQTPKNIEGLKLSAAKEYNYLYTGNNEDVMSFDINLNTAFMRTASANYGNAYGAAGTAVANQKIAGEQPDGATAGEGSASSGTAPPKDGSEAIAGTKEIIKPEVTTAMRNADVRRQVAEVFHDSLINTPSDLVTADMTIWGDPFFLPQEIGNYHPARAGNLPNTTVDGTMTYTEGQVYININFRTPFDYQENGSQIEMPVLVPQFSGLYMVVTCTNTFSKGQYTQNLHLVRAPNQDKTKVTENTVGGMKVSPAPAGYQSTVIPDASKKQPLQELAETALAVTSAINQASNLLQQGKNAGASVAATIGDLANVAKQGQAAISSLTSTGSIASAALSGLDGLKSQAGTTANKAADMFGKTGKFDAGAFEAGIPKIEIPGGIGSGSFGADLSLAINNALVSAVPSFGAVSVDFTSVEGQLAILGANLKDGFNDALGSKVPPVIPNLTDDLKDSIVTVAGASLSPASVVASATGAKLPSFTDTPLQTSLAAGQAKADAITSKLATAQKFKGMV